MYNQIHGRTGNGTLTKGSSLQQQSIQEVCESKNSQPSTISKSSSSRKLVDKRIKQAQAFEMKRGHSNVINKIE